MRLSLCVILAAILAARARRISPNDVGDSAAGVTYRENPLDDALTLSEVAGKRSTSLPQPEPPDDISNHSTTHLQQAKADLAAAVKATQTQSEVGSRLAGETEFEEVLQAAIREIMLEGKAMAQAAHDQVFHHGYYRAVKSTAAAKAAAEVANKAIATASQMATVVGTAVVFKKLREESELGPKGTVNQFLDDIDKSAKQYVKNAEEQFQKYPKMDGLEALLAQTKALEEQVGARRGKAFDGELMTDVMLGLIKVMNKALYFQYRVKSETTSIKRALQQDVEQDMSKKMKSEVGLDAFLKHIAEWELILHEEKVTKQKILEVNAGLNA